MYIFCINTLYIFDFRVFLIT